MFIFNQHIQSSSWISRAPDSIMILNMKGSRFNTRVAREFAKIRWNSLVQSQQAATSSSSRTTTWSTSTEGIQEHPQPHPPLPQAINTSGTQSTQFQELLVLPLWWIVLWSTDWGSGGCWQLKLHIQAKPIPFKALPASLLVSIGLSKRVKLIWALICGWKNFQRRSLWNSYQRLHIEYWKLFIRSAYRTHTAEYSIFLLNSLNLIFNHLFEYHPSCIQSKYWISKSSNSIFQLDIFYHVFSVLIEYPHSQVQSDIEYPTVSLLLTPFEVFWHD